MERTNWLKTVFYSLLCFDIALVGLFLILVILAVSNTIILGNYFIVIVCGAIAVNFIVALIFCIIRIVYGNKKISSK